MASDLVKESAEYVRGMMEDSIYDASRDVRRCSNCNEIVDSRVGCHYECTCGMKEGCGD